MINTLQALKIRSKTTLKMNSNTILKAIPNNSVYYRILALRDSSDVVILGGVLDGDRYQHTGMHI